MLLSVQIVVAIIVYVSLSDVPSEEIQQENKEGVAKQVYWTYEDENGPKEWVSIDPSYYACGGGYEQSPINIDKNSVWEERSFEKIEINYKPTKFLVENNGYTIEVKDPSGKNSLTIDGEEFTLVQIHFHLPSEHQLNGQTYNMEGHLVHEAKDGKQAVIGFFIKEGKVNTDLVDLWALLPEHITSQPIEVNRSIDLNEVLPEDKSVFQYSGSLTTPPCTEGVTWILFEKPVEMSAIQIEAFAEIYSHNNRPIQQLNDRKIYKFNLDN
ncbi:hypothetical protein CD29_11290 [Ureibacillus manganicus DSM 26584]|uniref:Carbonic anhydrase n=1 Tax=Ureibacillus manganicus DSM 26584 TaxID=1384049 RepID=A0A0A3I491_9BACL|nr:hypothetical protein CD29_11290 [Ureibacillus manganicus DSM 26584]